MPRSKMADRGSSAHFPELEAELLQWVTDRRLQGYGVSTAELKDYI
jgi:kynurenine formamidase